MKSVFVVVSHSGSIISRLIRKFTGDKYTHVSVSLDDTLRAMYSFSRIHTDFPVPGGFVRESAGQGVLAKFKNSDIVVIRLQTDDETYARLSAFLSEMYAERKKYRYNYRGIWYARHGKVYRRENRYYCSEFVKEVLEKFRLVRENELGEAVRPIEFLNLRGGIEVYRGKLCDYIPPEEVKQAG